MFNSTRPDGLDGWTISTEQYELLREHILGVLADDAEDAGVELRELIRMGQDRLGSHPAFPGGRLRNYITYTKVDLQARQEIERVPGPGAQRVRLRPTRT